MTGIDGHCAASYYRGPASLILKSTASVWSRVPAPEDLKNSKLFEAFSFNNSRPIQGLLPVDHSTAYNRTGT